MTVKTYNDFLRKLLDGVPCMLAYDTVADYLGLTNGGYREKIQIYVLEKQPVSGVEQVIISSFAEKNCQSRHGQSFHELDVPVHLRERFKKYSGWAKEYYKE